MKRVSDTISIGDGSAVADWLAVGHRLAVSVVLVVGDVGPGGQLAGGHQLVHDVTVETGYAHGVGGGTLIWAGRSHCNRNRF